MGLTVDTLVQVMGIDCLDNLTLFCTCLFAFLLSFLLAQFTKESLYLYCFFDNRRVVLEFHSRTNVCVWDEKM